MVEALRTPSISLTEPLAERTAINDLSQEVKNHLIDVFKKDFKIFDSSVFEQLSYAHLKEKYPQHYVLSPEDTATIYKSFTDTGVPDGLICEKSSTMKPLFVCEYTLVKPISSERRYFDRKVRLLSNYKKTFPQIFENAQLLFITPTYDSPKTRFIGNPVSVKYEQLPITHGDVFRYSEKLCRELSLNSGLLAFNRAAS
jgi:hypothetical protein